MVCTYNTPFLRYLGPACLSASFCVASQYGLESFHSYVRPSQRLAVVIPFYRGDLSRTVSSLGRWPTNCSPVTLHNMDLVLYYAEAGDDDNLTVGSAADAISVSAGRCFAKTRTVYANLGEGEDVYPKGPSAMFYKMYLDEGVRPYFAEYHALAVIEWDVLVTSERAFEQLYHSAFDETPDFWVKGSRMEGTDFHSNANSKGMWNVIGHINGNAIYNNDDPAFIEYVRYTHARWELDYPYDVALWMTVSDFPYSWLLWQRYSGKFVTTNLISNVGREHIDHDAVSDAIAAETLFIHGSHVDEGNMASIEATKSSRRALGGVEGANEKTHDKWRRDYETEVARMCLSGCTYTNKDGTMGRECDLSCESGEPYGTFGCGAKQGRFGDNCRVCYNDMTKAHRQDTPDDRAIMCDTLEPVPSAYDVPEKEKTREKCLTGCTYTSKDGTRGRVCDPSCESGEPYGTLGCGTKKGHFGANCRACYNDVTKARRQDTPENRAIMCDTLEPVPSAYDARSLASGLGHGIDSEHGLRGRRLSHDKEYGGPDGPDDGDMTVQAQEAMLPYTRDLLRGDICVFIAGRAGKVDEIDVTVTSILQFAPGVRMVVAAEEGSLGAFESSVGMHPGVTVRSTPNTSTASLFADDLCGVGTSLVFYIRSASVLSRTFTSKDTHSPAGDLLVVYSNSRLCYPDAALARQTSAMLGFEAPMFTCGTDLILPVGVNAYLRELLASNTDTPVGDAHEMAAAFLTKLGEIKDESTIPQMLAAVAYSRKLPGAWFVDPEAWASEHLFKAVSVWEIPLVKPRFSCSLEQDATHSFDDVAGLLWRNLKFFTQGGTCEAGILVPPV